jgi:hypothetical protein
MSRRGCSLPANASGFDPHRASITSRIGPVPPPPPTTSLPTSAGLAEAMESPQVAAPTTATAGAAASGGDGVAATCTGWSSGESELLGRTGRTMDGAAATPPPECGGALLTIDRGLIAQAVLRLLCSSDELALGALTDGRGPAVCLLNAFLAAASAYLSSPSHDPLGPFLSLCLPPLRVAAASCGALPSPARAASPARSTEIIPPLLAHDGGGADGANTQHCMTLGACWNAMQSGAPGRRNPFYSTR